MTLRDLFHPTKYREIVANLSIKNNHHDKIHLAVKKSRFFGDPFQGKTRITAPPQNQGVYPNLDQASLLSLVMARM